MDLTDLLRRLSHLVHFFAREITLARPESLLSDPLLRSQVETARAEMVFTRLGELFGPRAASGRGEVEGPPLALELELDRSALPWLRALAERPPLGRPSLYLRLSRPALDEPEARSALELAAVLFERGESIHFLPRPAAAAHGAMHGGPGRSGEGLSPLVSKVTVNLPRAAFRSAADRARTIERELEEVLDLCVKAHLERRRFLERLGANRENPLWDLLGRPTGAEGRPLVALSDVEFPIGILGLNECVKFLTGHELHQDPRARKAGLALVEVIARKVSREARGLGLRLVLWESRNVGAVRRLEEIDRLRFPASGEVDRGRAAAVGRPGWSQGARYTDGVRMHCSAPVDPLKRIEHLSAYLDRVVPTGVIEDSPELKSGGEELILSLLEESMPHMARLSGEGEEAKTASGLRRDAGGPPPEPWA